MNEECVVCDSQAHGAAESIFFRMFGVEGKERERASSARLPIPRHAAADIVKLFEQPFAVRPDAESLEAVIGMPGKTAWASATASDAHAATRHACAQHDMKTAKGALVIVSLSPESGIVPSIKAVLGDVYRQTPAACARAFAFAHDEALKGQVRVEILLTGL